ncbi:phage tail tape measure protein [Pseudomonas sp. 273]|uniref:phage tail tape measure protein n=1 Tax=Pseudomonas sp. 273 TaxID=75692 RepID=UPI0023D80549|nr:phage tail tape measure protein [Pseudomonas sp. 273]
MSEKQKISIMLGGVLDASFGAVVADAGARLEALRRGGERAFDLQGLVGETRQLQAEYLRLHRIGDAQAGITLRALEGNLALLRRQGLEVGNLAKLYDRLGRSVRGSELRAQGWQQLESAGRRLGELGRFGSAMGVPIGIAADYQARIRALAIRGGIAGTAQEQQLSQRVQESAQQSGMSREDSASLLAALMDRGMRQQDAQALLPLAAKFARSQGAGLDDTAALLRNLQLKAGIEAPAELAKTLDALAFLGQQGEFETADLARYLPDLLSRARPQKGQGREAVVRLGAMLALQMRKSGSPEEAAERVGEGLKGHLPASGGGEALQHLQGQALQASGVVDNVLLQRNDTTSARIGAARASGESLLGAVGDALVPYVDPALEMGSEAFRRATQVVNDNPGVVASAVGLFGAYKGARALFDAGRGAVNLARGGLLGAGAGKLPEIASLAGNTASGAGAAPPAVLDAAGKGGARLAHGGRLLLRGAAPLSAGLAVLGAVETYASDGSAQEKGEGYGGAAGALVGTALGAAVGSIVPVVGTAIGGALGGLLGEKLGGWGGGRLGAWLGKDSAAAKAERMPEPKLPPAAPTLPPVQNWHFSPQITLNVGGGLFEPRLLAEQLLPQLRRLLDEFNSRQRNDSLFDLPRL